MAKLKEIDAELSGVNKAHFFLKKAKIGVDLEERVVTAAGGDRTDYEKLRKALTSIRPLVKKSDNGGGHQGGGTGGSDGKTHKFKKIFIKKTAHGVHEVENPEEQEEDSLLFSFYS